MRNAANVAMKTNSNGGIVKEAWPSERLVAAK